MTTARRFAPLRREPTLAETVAARIEELVRELRPGDPFPSERALAEQFAVSRTVVREAVRSLAARGLLDVRHGSGTTIAAPSADLVARSVTSFLLAGEDVAEVHEARRMLEVETARLAALRRDERELGELRTLVERMAALEGRGALAEADVAFHAALARATRNRLFPLLHASLADALLALRRTSFGLAGAREHALAHHRAILAAVAAGDPDGAAAAMRGHLDEGEAWFERARREAS